MERSTEKIEEWREERQVVVVPVVAGFFYRDHMGEAVIFSPFSLVQFRGRAQLMELPIQSSLLISPL